MRLIITEKNNSARKIAEILSGGIATEKKSFTVPIFRWEDAEGETAVVGTVIRAVQKEAKAADSLVIGTDFDREGELIGLEALEVCLDVNPDLEPTLKRARFSALTQEEIDGAFGNLDQLSYPLANAAGARQDIDLIWGAAFTRVST